MILVAFDHAHKFIWIEADYLEQDSTLWLTFQFKREAVAKHRLCQALVSFTLNSD